MGGFRIPGTDIGWEPDTSQWGVGDVSLDPDRIINDAIEGIEDYTDDLDKFVLEDLLGIELELPDLPAQLKGVLLTKQGNINHIPVVYGTRLVGGHRTFVGTTGTNNEYLHLVYALCEGEVEAIASIYINDTEIAVGDLDGSGNVNAGVFNGLCRIKKYVGTDAQTADADLVSEVTDWTTNHRLRGVAYVYIRCKWDQDNRAFGSFPRIKAMVQGKKLYDPRDLSTAYSTNPALCLYDYLTDTRYGRGLPAADLDVTSFEDAADYCETQVTPYTAAGYTDDTFACNGVLDTGRTVLANIKPLLDSCRGWMPYLAGKWTLVLDKAETPSFTFDKTNIIGSMQISRGGKTTRFNRVQATYASPAENYEPDITLFDSSAFRTEDNGLLLESRITLPFETDVYRANRLAELKMKQSRQGIVVKFKATLAALEVATGQVVYMTHDTPGWTSKAFRARVDLLPNATVAVVLTEYESSVYNLTAQTAAATPPDTNLPDPNTVAVPSGLALVSTGQALVAQDGTLTVRIKATWTPSADIFVSSYDVEFKKSADSNWIPAANPIGQAAAETFIHNVQDNVNYDVRIRARNTNDAVSAWLASTNHLIATTANAIAAATATLAASITGQGALATQNTADWQTDISGTGIPDDNADVTSANTAAAITGQGALATLNTVDTAQIVAAAVEAAQLATNAITAIKISANAVTETKILDNAVSTGKIATNAVTANEIAALTITAAEIAANTITAAKIAALTITAAEIAAGTITAAKMNVANLSAIVADLGSVTAGSIVSASYRTATSGQRIDINNDTANSIVFFGSNGTTVEELASIGAQLTVDVIAEFGTLTTTNARIAAKLKSYLKSCLHAECAGGAVSAAYISHTGSHSGGKGIEVYTNGARGININAVGGYGAYIEGQTAAADVAPLVVRPNGAGIPSHSVAEGSFWTNTAGDVYYYDGANWARLLLEGRGDVDRASLNTGTTSLAGSVSSESFSVAIELEPYSFFPMIHNTTTGTDLKQQRFIAITGNSSDLASADSPCFEFVSAATGNNTWDVDFRYINA